MSEPIKTKVDLNKVTHSVRAAQAVLQYGVGSMVDFPERPGPECSISPLCWR